MLHRAKLAPSRKQSSRINNWKAFGPTAEWSDGDAEYFKVTNQLADKYEWFAPQHEEQEPSTAPQQEEEKPEYGLTPKQIAALGLSGSQAHLPDPVSEPV